MHTSQLQHGAAWPAGIPLLTSLHSQSSTLAQSGAHAGTSRGSAVSTLLTHSNTHTSTTLLIPKTEKLSPVQLYGTDMSSLTGGGELYLTVLTQYFKAVCLWTSLELTLWLKYVFYFSSHSGQTSPPNPLDKVPNPESPHSGFPRHGKLDSSKVWWCSLTCSSWVSSVKCFCSPSTLFLCNTILRCAIYSTQRADG